MNAMVLGRVAAGEIVPSEPSGWAGVSGCMRKYLRPAPAKMIPSAVDLVEGTASFTWHPMFSYQSAAEALRNEFIFSCSGDGAWWNLRSRHELGNKLAPGPIRPTPSDQAQTQQSRR